ncbi:ABC transporter substrate-binding protein [Paenarthrobacter sp. Z7-10]|uniref:ABC transporter substrate-binding protein n=1 Tax=Paenarthrobacter sp. Z7-10 TaxID=2787635 RepID=UPI0022A9AE42|nr:extracellular solute-binding protein [Paenarthrobacter sp. Z7-10]
MRRIKFGLGMAAALSVALLTGCGGGASEPAKAGPAPTDLKAEITYGYWDVNQKPAMDKVISQFNQDYPNIKVTSEVTPYAQYFTKLQTQGSSNTLPDVFWMNGPNFQLYASNGQLAPMTALTDSKQVDPANYPESLNKLYSLDGKQYGVPKDFDTIALWYNKALFKQAGVAVPTADWTWDDFHKAAKTISDKLKSKGIYGVATNMSGGQEGYYDSILQAGGSIISADGKKSGYDDPKSIKGLQLWADLIADGSSPTMQQLSDTPANKWFDNGKAAMEWTGTWQVSEIKASPVKDDASVAPLPKGEQKATVIHGLANVVSAKSKNLQAAQAFQAFLGTKAAALTQANMGAANPAFNGTQQAFVDSVPSFNIKVFEDAANEYAFPFPVSKNTAAWNQLETDLLPDAFAGKKPVADVAKELADKMNALLAKE